MQSYPLGNQHGTAECVRCCCFRGFGAGVDLPGLCQVWEEVEEGECRPLLAVCAEDVSSRIDALEKRLS